MTEQTMRGKAREKIIERMGGVNYFQKLNIETQALIDAVEKLIEEAREQRQYEDFGAVNWGDIGIADIEYRISVMRPADGPYCAVLLEEASPECKLGGWIQTRISVDYPQVVIECEW